MKPLYIFDLDGTLALIGHRRHFVENRANRWKEFHEACVDDLPNTPVISILRLLRASGADVHIFSGRSDEVQAQTKGWLLDHVHTPYADPLPLTMRKAGDYTPDDQLKRQWYEALPPYDKVRLQAIFDDRDRVVAMWRSMGLTCFQVAPGDF